MSDMDGVRLLRDALDLLNDRPNFSLRRNRGATSYALASRIDAYLAQRTTPVETLVAVARAREEWKTEPRISIDDGECKVSAVADGVWVRAWVLVRLDPPLPADGLPDPAVRARYAAAMAALDPVTREAFMLNAVDGLSYTEIGGRMSMPVAEVEEHVARALRHLDRWFSP